MSGTREASSSRPAPSSRSRSCSDRRLVRSRIASRIGAKGTVPSPSGTHPPMRTSAPDDSACWVTSVTSRVLPTPASPTSSMRTGAVPDEPMRAAVIVSTSLRRPTKVGLDTRAMAAILGIDPSGSAMARVLGRSATMCMANGGVRCRPSCPSSGRSAERPREAPDTSRSWRRQSAGPGPPETRRRGGRHRARRPHPCCRAGA